MPTPLEGWLTRAEGRRNRSKRDLQRAGNPPLETRSGLFVNLSPYGAMVESREIPRQGIFILLKCGPVDVLGKVTWSGRGSFGVKFDEPISDELVLSLADSIEQPATVWQPRSATIYKLRPDQ